jgi:hypothetical protein
MMREMSPEARARMLSGLKPGGQKTPYRRKAKRSNAEHARQYGQEMIDRLVEIARHGEPDAARIVAAHSVLDRGFGKVLGSDPAATTPQIVNVVTGVHRDPEFGKWGGDTVANPPQRPLLPDGRDPFEQPAPPARPVRSSDSPRPMGRAPVAEPPSHRLFEGEADVPSALVHRGK